MTIHNEFFKHLAEVWGPILVYLASTVNFIVEVVNPLLSTVGLGLAIVWWIIKIKNEKKNKKGD